MEATILQIYIYLSVIDTHVMVMLLHTPISAQVYTLIVIARSTVNDIFAILQWIDIFQLGFIITPIGSRLWIYSTGAMGTLISSSR